MRKTDSIPKSIQPYPTLHHFHLKISGVINIEEIAMWYDNDYIHKTCLIISNYGFSDCYRLPSISNSLLISATSEHVTSPVLVDGSGESYYSLFYHLKVFKSR